MSKPRPFHEQYPAPWRIQSKGREVVDADGCNVQDIAGEEDVEDQIFWQGVIDAVNATSGAIRLEAFKEASRSLRESADKATFAAERLLMKAQGKDTASKRGRGKIHGLYSVRKNCQFRARFFREAADLLDTLAAKDSHD